MKVKFTLRACGGEKSEVVEIEENDGVINALNKWVHDNIDSEFEYIGKGCCYECTHYHGDKTYFKAWCGLKSGMVDKNGTCDDFITEEELYRIWKDDKQ